MKLRIYIFLLTIIGLSSGCEKLLDKDPVDKLSIEDTFRDISGAKSALAGAYRNLLSTELYHLNLMVYPDIYAGNIKFSKSANLRLDDVYAFAQNAADCSMNDTYIELYAQINNLNNIIKYTPTSEGDAKEKNRIIAEAKCLRALAHFELLRIYSRRYNFTPDASHLGIAVILQPLTINDAPPARLTCAQSYQAVIDDLLAADNLFDDSSPIFSKGAPQTYFSKLAAKALLSKVYLYTNNYDKAFQYSDEVIKSGSYTLLSNANYVNSWATRTPSVESIFEIGLEANFSGNSLGSYYETSNQGGFRMFAATNDLLNLYSSTDVRRQTSMFNTVNINSTNYYFTKKYATGGIDATPVKLLRLSELYLIRAEAAAEKNSPDFNQANADLNLIIKRADPAATTINYTTKSILVDAILLERRKELAFEGNLAYDLFRKGRDIVRVDVTSITKNLESSSLKTVMPIPLESLFANKNLEKNPGY